MFILCNFSEKGENFGPSNADHLPSRRWTAEDSASRRTSLEKAKGGDGGKSAGRGDQEAEENDGEEDHDGEEDEEEEDMTPVLEYVEIRESSQGGFGLFALKDFEIGDLVIRERPFLNIRQLPWEDVDERIDDNSQSSSMIRNAVQELDPEMSALYWSFTQTSLYGDIKTPQGVFWTNMIELYQDSNEEEEEEEAKEESCMFRVTSRLNHSCVPHVEWVSRVDIPSLDSVAVREIKKGEEILVSYKETAGGHQDTLERRQYLHKWYGFNCMCRHCKAYLDRYNLT